MTTTDRTPEELAYQRANIAAGLGDPYAEEAPTARELAAELTASGTLDYPASPVPGPVCPECGTDAWDFTSNDQARCANGHSWTQPVEDDQASPTPVADALQLVDQAQAQPRPRFGNDRPGELDALRALADAVRSHGIGAELGQRREPGCDVCGLPLERVDVNGPGEYAHAGDEPADGHAPVLPRAFVPPA